MAAVLVVIILSLELISGGLLTSTAYYFYCLFKRSQAMRRYNRTDERLTILHVPVSAFMPYGLPLPIDMISHVGHAIRGPSRTSRRD